MPGKGTTSGFVTKRFGSTSTQPPRLRRSLATIRWRSRLEAVGRRIPNEFTQSTRFLLARMRMMWVLLVGSLPQSLAKQTMDAPSSIGDLALVRALSRGPGDGRDVLTVEEDPLPDLQVHEEPEAIAVLGSSRAVLFGKTPHRGGNEQVSFERPRSEHELLDDGPE